MSLQWKRRTASNADPGGARRAHLPLLAAVLLAAAAAGVAAARGPAAAGGAAPARGPAAAEPAPGAAPPDLLGRSLAEVGFERRDLGFTPRGYWNRFPLDVPYRLPAFDDLFAEPLRLYDYATTMANAVELYLDPAYADSTDDGLYQLLYYLGVDRRRGGFRSYSANLAPAPATTEPLVTACERLALQAGRPLEARSFGSPADQPSLGQRVRRVAGALPDTVRAVLAELVVNLGEAVRWQALAFRNCDREDMRAASALRDLATTQGDGQVYHPELDDLAATIDLASLHYAALKTAAAAERAERRLLPLAASLPAGFAGVIPTPYGRIVLLAADARPDSLFSDLAGDAAGALCVIDCGGDRHWRGGAGAATPATPISVLIDLGGDDVYGDPGQALPPTTGVGLCGIGLVIDSAGNDRYFGTTYAQGAGLFGVGVLLDRAGDDVYQARESAQGCGYFGIGLCLDGTGDDTYDLCGDGQGHGGIGGGVGVLAAFSGDDRYTAEPLAAVCDRGDYHSDGVINANNAQGAGCGRRGDGSDGHAWAGGLGALLDLYGNDRYASGNWTLGIGYWFGTGIVVDRAGDDQYRSCYFTQASGAHFANGILIDESGNDRHQLYETAGAGLAFGWDFTNALLVEQGGNDRYRASRLALGLAQIRSHALLLELGGDDRYELGAGAAGLGAATWRADYARPGRLYAYNRDVTSFGGFVDAGGDDVYLAFDADGTTHPQSLARNDTLWLQPARGDTTFGAANFGVGIDTGSGSVPELRAWE